MVKVSAPALSLKASGSLGGALVFAEWKGRAYVRSLVTPSNPRSGLQVGTRSMFKFLAQNWAGIEADDKASWAEIAATINASTFNAYMKNNMVWWRRFAPPSMNEARAKAGTPGTYGFLNAVGGVRHATLGVAASSAEDNWGCILFRSPTGSFTPSLSNAIGVILLNTTTETQFIDSDLAAGTYYYDSAFFTEDGVIQQNDDEQSAVVT